MESAAPAVKKQKTGSEEAVGSQSEKTKSTKRYKSAPSVNKQLEEDPKLHDIDDKIDGKETKIEFETEKLTKPAEDEKDGLAETLICIICQEILHDCIRCVVLCQNQTKCKTNEIEKPDKVNSFITQYLMIDCVCSLQPCMHSFCAGCYSDWMERSNECPSVRIY